LFCVHLDVSLLAQRDAGAGCFTRQWLIGALTYADDTVLLAPTARAMRKLLLIGDEFADDFRIKLNANKAACLDFNSSQHRSVVSKELPSSIVRGQLTENVNQCSVSPWLLN
jgi:hypothetical protein